MATSKQELGTLGEKLVAGHSSCPRCKKARTLRRLPPNFKCADVVCDFCGYLAQIKTTVVRGPARLPKRLLGAAWGVQKARMEAGIFFPLFIVVIGSAGSRAIFYLSADLQPSEMFRPRRALSAQARRAGWQGFLYDLAAPPEGAIVCLYRSPKERLSSAARA